MSDNPFDLNSSEEAAVESKVEVVPPSALEALNRAEVDISISTAKRWKRDVAQAIKTCGELALRNPQIARTCNYAVPRGGKTLVGPSVHFARLAAYSWGNLTALSRVIGCDRANAHLQGVCHDLQTNYRIGIEMDWPVQPPHKETPERWTDQMNLAKRGGGAVALRVAIFNVIPLVLFSDIAEKAKLIAIGEGKSFEQSRAAAMSAFKELGVTKEQIYAYLDRGGLESITTDDLILLHGLLVSIQERTASVEELFGKYKDKTAVKPQVPARAQTGFTIEQIEQAKKTGVIEQDFLSKEAPPEPAPARTRLRKREVATPRETAPRPAAPPPPPAPAQPRAETAPEAAPPAPPAPEPAASAPAAPAPVAPAPQVAPSLADRVREHLRAGGYSEDEFLSVLEDFDLNRARAKTIETVATQDLVMVLSDWDSVIDQLNTHREQAEFPI